jgi:hypothetical protein
VCILLGPLPRLLLVLPQAAQVLPGHHRILRVIWLRRRQQSLRRGGGRGRKRGSTCASKASNAEAHLAVNSPSRDKKTVSGQHAGPACACAALPRPPHPRSHLQAEQRRLQRQRGAPLVFEDVQADGAVGRADVGVPDLRSAAGACPAMPTFGCIKKEQLPTCILIQGGGWRRRRRGGGPPL